MDKKAFYNRVRSTVFGGALTAAQVEGTELILAEANRRATNTEFLADILATTAWETARTMQPITEYGGRSYFNKYEPGTKIGKNLGNTQAGDGYHYRGRGYVQITGRANYAKASRKLGVDLVGSPERTLEPGIAVRILFDGMTEGWFTGKKLSDYLDGLDEPDGIDLAEFKNARRVVNGTDKDDEIAALALKFERALRGSGRAENGTAELPAPVAPEPAPAPPVVPPEAPAPTPAAPTASSVLVRILRAILAYLREPVNVRVDT